MFMVGWTTAAAPADEVRVDVFEDLRNVSLILESDAVTEVGEVRRPSHQAKKAAAPRPVRSTEALMRAVA